MAVSPDGAHVAFVVTHRRSREEHHDVARSGSTTLPPRRANATANPTWSPDGRFLAFTSKRGETGRRVDPARAAGRRGRRAPNAVHHARRPRRRRVVAGRPLARLHQPHRDERYDAEERRWQAPRKVERFFARLNGEDWVFDRPTTCTSWRATAPGSPATSRQERSSTAASAGCRLAGDRHLRAAPRHVGPRPRRDLYVVPRPSAATRRRRSRRPHRPRRAVQPALGVARRHAGRASSASRPGGLPAERAGGRAADRRRDRSDGISGSPRASTARSSRPPATRAPVWGRTRSLLATAEDRGATHLYRLPTDGTRARRRSPAARSGADVRRCRRHHRHVPRSHRRAPGRAVRRRRRAHPRRPTISRHAARVGALHRADCTDGTDEIDAWIMRPAGFDATQRYPVLLNVHGGPHTQYGETFFDEAQMQAAAGFVVVMCNPRGGSGRHTGWGQAIMGPDAPDSTRVGLGLGRRRRRDRGARHRARPLPVLRPRPGRACSAAATAATWPRCSPAAHGDRFRAHLLGARGQQPASPRSGRATSPRSSASSTAPTTSTHPPSTCDVADAARPRHRRARC